MNATLSLGGDLELAVPITVDYRVVKYVPATRDGPAEGGYCDIISVDRTDGMAWHDGCQAAFDAWWEATGHDLAIERNAEDADYAAECAAEHRYEMQREARL